MRYVTTIRCSDRPGVVRTVAEAISDVGGNIVESGQFTDSIEDLFVMRVAFDSDASDVEVVRTQFRTRMEGIDAVVHVRPANAHRRMLIMVSRYDHCLLDLLYRKSMGELHVDIPLIVSNHRDASEIAVRHGIKFEHLPVTPETKADAEASLMRLVDENDIDFVVLARYMQVLSPQLCAALQGRIINIHHSFLPGFKGANPYRQAFERGVKLIGATAHYVTDDLDEGPIIEQDVVRVTHAHDVEQMVALGRDVERSVLSRAVAMHAEDRVFQVGPRTYVL